MFDLSDTLVAICTPKGTGAIAAIRVSGSDSWHIANRIFSQNAHPSSLISNPCFMHMHALHGYIYDGNKTIDEVIILPYKAPNSFTREDVIEIFCHGGYKVTSMILELCLKMGARLAKPGEFTFRAFINGRIDLTEAEAINELINATTDNSVNAAFDIVTGSLKKKVKEFREKIYLLITSLEGAIEFPMDVTLIDKKNLHHKLNNIKDDLLELIIASKDGCVLRDGIKLSIVGEPNVGKSSLFNQILESERAIVTDIPGTTRDTIEEKVVLGGWPFVFVDTAGIRDHQYVDEVEKHGIDRTRSAIEKSDIVLYVTDLSRQKSNGRNDQVLREIKNKPKIVVGNKIDLVETCHGISLRNMDCDIAISAKYGINMDKLKRLLIEKLEHSKSNINNQIIFVNERQSNLLQQVVSSLDFAMDQIVKEIPDDLIADELKKAVSKLDEVSGSNVNEEVINNIFSKFCIGK